MKSLIAAIALIALLAPQPSDAGISISPRLAIPIGDFGDIVGTGFGATVTMDKEVKGKPGKVGLTFLTFGEGDQTVLGTTATAIGAFAGYRHQLSSVYLKVDTSLLRISSESKVGDFKVTADETKLKITPGVGMEFGQFGVEADIDLAGDWAGINLFYMIGSE
jgi:hypothetical protein